MAHSPPRPYVRFENSPFMTKASLAEADTFLRAKNPAWRTYAAEALRARTYRTPNRTPWLKRCLPIGTTPKTRESVRSLAPHEELGMEMSVEPLVKSQLRPFTSDFPTHLENCRPSSTDNRQLGKGRTYSEAHHRTEPLRLILRFPAMTERFPFHRFPKLQPVPHDTYGIPVGLRPFAMPRLTEPVDPPRKPTRIPRAPSDRIRFVHKEIRFRQAFHFLRRDEPRHGSAPDRSEAPIPILVPRADDRAHPCRHSRTFEP